MIPGSDTSLNVFCNQVSIHASLAERCFRTMNSLRFNICELPSSFLLDEEVEDVDKRKQKITEILCYSSCHWGQHLARADSEDSRNKLLELLGQFLDKKLLFWIEAMNLIHSKAQCIPQLQEAHKWLQKACVIAVKDESLIYTG